MNEETMKGVQKTTDMLVGTVMKYILALILMKVQNSSCGLPHVRN